MTDWASDELGQFLERMTRPYLDFYKRNVAKPIWLGLDMLSRSPLGDPNVYAMLQSLGPPGRLGGSLGGLAAQGLRAGAGLGARELEMAGVPIRRLAAAAQLAQNAKAGGRAEIIAEELAKARGLEIARQVTLRTKSGVTFRADLLVRDPETGRMRVVEVKLSQSARVRKLQSKGLSEVRESGAVVVGKGKPIAPGGTYLPPHEVEIIRDPQWKAP